MPPNPNRRNVVDADPERIERMDRVERVDRGLAIAAMLQAIPWFVWAAPLVLLFGFILLAMWFQRDNLSDFTSQVLVWLWRVLIGVGVILVIRAIVWGFNFVDEARTKLKNQRMLSENIEKVHQGVVSAQKKNLILDADLDVKRQMPQLLASLVYSGTPFEYDARGNLKSMGRGNPQTFVTQVDSQGQLGPGAQGALPAPAGELPTSVRYEDVRGQVPVGHILVGIGLAGVETKEMKVGALVWIVGLSGTGKTSTTVLRVEERAVMEHRFLGYDPHWFKDDSLTNAIYVNTETGQKKGYHDLFLMPMARNTAEGKAVLKRFLDEFDGRKSGRIPKPWQPWTILIDEVGSLMDVTDEEEEEVAKMIKRIARICGQEARNFLMGGIYVSQQATGLAWLRKTALMVIVHQLLMMSERELACNGDKSVMKGMEFWPIGRTLVYGVGFGTDGARVVQQPYFGGRGVDLRPTEGTAVEESSVQQEDFSEFEEPLEDDDPSLQSTQPVEYHTEDLAPTPALVGDLRRAHDAYQQLKAQGAKTGCREIAEATGFKKDKSNDLLNELARLGYIPPRKERSA